MPQSGCVVFWGIPEGQLQSFWMALLSSVTVPIFFPLVFPLVFTQGWLWEWKMQSVTPGHHSDPGGNLGKRVWLTKKTRPGVFSQSNPDPGHPTPRRWKRLRTPSSGVGSEVGEPRNLFPRLGVG